MEWIISNLLGEARNLMHDMSLPHRLTINSGVITVEDPADDLAI
jgi:hypothetical protein